MRSSRAIQSSSVSWSGFWLCGRCFAAAKARADGIENAEQEEIREQSMYAVGIDGSFMVGARLVRRLLGKGQASTSV